MQKFLAKYALAAHLALVAVAPLFLSASIVLWLTLLAALWLFLEPSCRNGENLHRAHRRVVGSVIRDPLVWVMLVLAVVTWLRSFNDGVKLAYDAENSVWSLANPACALFPGCVSGVGGMEATATAALLVLLTAARHSVGKSARYAFLLLASALSGFCVIILSMMFTVGYEGVRTLTVCSLDTPSYSGVFYGVWFLAGMVGLLSIFEQRWFRAVPLALVGVGCNAAGVFMFAPAWTSVVFAAAAGCFLVYSFVYACKALSGSGEFRYLMTFCIALGVGCLTVFVGMSEDLMIARAESWMKMAFFPDGFQAIRDALSSVASKVWLSHMWLGTGLGSFNLDLRLLATDADWQIVAPTQFAALNGFWNLLAERGIVGAVMLACPLALLLWSFALAFAKGVRRGLPHPAAFCGFFALLAVVAEAFVDVSFVSPGVMVAVAATLAISARSFPKEKGNG